MPTIKLDGREIPFEQGDTVIRAAHRAGIDVPHYCWHPGLSVAANCRMCLVEVLPAAGQRPMRLDVLRHDPVSNKYVTDQKPKLQPACQQACTDGLEVLSDSSKHVAEARQSVQEMLLLNHPVDCPICDQAGECRLQDYWLEHGRYKKRMHDEIIHKPKAVSFGPTIVYDAERCIVCTRCVRFVEEVAKDPVLDKRERGNLGEIFVAPGRELDNNYTLMTEHVCPVGALTSKDFRFKARVWFLRSVRSVCQGCETGCNSFLDYDPRTMTAYRYRPRENLAVNQYWMCDVGMLSYRRTHENRINHPRVAGKTASRAQAIAAAEAMLRAAKGGGLGVVLSAQHSNEDNVALAELARRHLGAVELFLSGKPKGPADGILYREDKNPNTAGATRIAGKALRPFEELLSAVESGRVSHVLALGAEAPVAADKLGAAFGRLAGLVVIAAHEGPLVASANVVLPAATWAEAAGTYTNFQGLDQRAEKAIAARFEERPAWEWLSTLAQEMGFAMRFATLKDVRRALAPDAAAPVAASL